MGAAASIDQAQAEKLAKGRFDAALYDSIAQGGALRVVVLSVPKGSKAGLSFSKAGCVSKVNAGGLAEKSKVAVGWRCYDVDGAAVNTSAEINDALAAARKSGKPFKVTFLTAAKGKAAKAAGGKEAVCKAAPKGPSEAELAAAKKAEEEAAAEEAAARKAAEEEAARKAAEEEEARRRKELGNGKVVIRYEMYAEEFDIVDGSTTAAAVDDLYCLSDVMPKCRIFLSPISPQEKMTFLDEGIDAFYYVEEDPKQTYRGLETTTAYYAYVQENDDEFKKYQQKTRRVFCAEVKEERQRSEYAEAGIPETCSCVYGNPCVDEYGCKNWAYRYAIAKKNGWKEAF